MKPGDVPRTSPTSGSKAGSADIAAYRHPRSSRASAPQPRHEGLPEPGPGLSGFLRNPTFSMRHRQYVHWTTGLVSGMVIKIRFVDAININKLQGLRMGAGDKQGRAALRIVRFNTW